MDEITRWPTNRHLHLWRQPESVLNSPIPAAIFCVCWLLRFGELACGSSSLKSKVPTAKRSFAGTTAKERRLMRRCE